MTSSELVAGKPTVSRRADSGRSPWVGTVPAEGFHPAMPHQAAGIRTEPMVSEPSASHDMPAATAAPEPPLDPPA